MADQVKVRVTGEEAGVLTMLRTVSRQLTTFEGAQRRLTTSTGQAGRAQRAASGDARAWGAAQQAGQSAAAGLTRRLVALAAAYGGIRTVLSGIRRGLDVNAELESNQLGIASLITSQADLADATGRVLTGTEALNAAQAISEDQLKALRVAGILTAATFGQLSRVFQTAVGPGLAAGLELDEIRKVTVGITQAAGALNVPMDQLDQEVRSILAGEIDVNSRVAKTLGITNAQVKLERERGTLAEFLLSRTEAFAAAGERAQGTWAGIKSQAQETLDVFAEEATRPLFTRLAAAGREALSRVFEVSGDNVRIAPAFAGIVALAQGAFGGLGDLLARAITAAVDGAERLSGWVERNRDDITDFARQAGAAATAIFGAVVQARELGAKILTAANNSGLISAGFVTIEATARLAGEATGLVADNLGLVVTILTGAALARGIALIGGLSALPTALGLAGLAIAAAPFTAAVAAITGIAVAVRAVEIAQERARQATLRANAAQTTAAREAPALVEEYTKLAGAIESGALKGEDLKKAQERVRDIKNELLRLSPEFRAALGNENDSLQQQADKAAEVVTQLRAARQEKIKSAQAELASLRVQQQQLAARAPASTDAQFVAQQARIQKVKEAIEQTEAALRSLGVEAAKPVKLGGVLVTAPGGAPAGPPTVTPKTGTGTGTGLVAGAKNDLKQLTDAAIQEQERAFAAYRADLDRQLEAGLLSWDEYFGNVERAAFNSFDAQRAALDALLTGTKDQGDRAKIVGDLAEIERQRTALVAEHVARRAALEQGLTRQIEGLQIEQLRATGDTVEARRLELTASFAELRATLVRENRAEAVAIIDSLIDVGVARERLDLLQGEFQRAASARSVAEESVQTRVAAGVISERQAREELLGIYTRQRDAIAALLPALRATAAATSNATDATQVAQYALEVEKLNLLIQQTGDEWFQVKEQVRDSFTSDLTNFLASGINQVHSLGQGLAQLAATLIGSVQSIVANVLSKQIVDGLTKLAGNALGGGGGEGAAKGAGDAIAQQAGAAVMNTAITTAGVAAAGSMGGAVSTAGVTAAGTMGGAITTAGGFAAGAMGTAIEVAGARAAAAMAAAITSGNAAGTAASGASAVAGSIKLARGGFVRGRGTSTSDSIPADLSKGEYVIRAAAVRQIGVAELDALNAMGRGIRTPRLRPLARRGRYRFNAGGLVPAGAPAGSASVDVSGRVSVALEDGLVPREIRSRGGKAAVLEVIQANRSTIKALLGGFD